MVHESIAVGTGFGIGAIWGPTRYFASFSRWSGHAAFFSGPQNEIWTRLGPQEAYGVPLVLAGLAWIVVQLERHNWQPTWLFPGFAVLLLAGFVKESFIPVLPGALAFIYMRGVHNASGEGCGHCGDIAQRQSPDTIRNHGNLHCAGCQGQACPDIH